MSEPKFTPGQWAYEMSDNYARIYLHNHLDKKNIYGKDSLCGYCGEANAALIAAAPELYAALVDCAIDLENEIRNREGYAVPRHFERDLMVVERAVAVLKKAKGE